MNIYTSRKHSEAVDALCDELGVSSKLLNIKMFGDQEIHVDVQDALTEATVFFYHEYAGDPNRWVMEALLAADAFRRAGANQIHLIAPYLVYSRQDVPDDDQATSYSSPLICRHLSDVYDGLLVVDLHAPQTQGFFQIPVHHVSTSSLVAQHIKQHHNEQSILVAPDLGGSKRVESIQGLVGGSMVVIEKKRSLGQVESMQLIGDVAGKACIIVDDVLVSGESLSRASELLVNHGATSVTAYVTHLLMQTSVTEWLQTTQIDRMYITDTVAHPHFEEQGVSIVPKIAAWVKQKQGGKNDS
ncbi:ribose-phosphate diphosphokinase [Candidatus Comchoanobacter bicostacola]|uniref:ribose-phosphate diphosphokinase n=1 Tax=Candidatus Comchoanobacter bicostacola TaxID=2919598 RepID=A0ABY5DL85_9GAMM|nr:ribose-phosphate diphosphokinase [Candidatus Comchoanobacter bicostacola]UTC24566.1 ribose-phosphate diphosphokinase [Candidatus Comchoanobacter bicostacola]